MEFIEDNFILLWLSSGMISAIILQIVLPSSNVLWKKLLTVAILSLFGFGVFGGLIMVLLIMALASLSD